MHSLPPEEAQAYAEARDDLAAMLVAAQRLTLNTGQTAREALRVVRRLPLELQLASGPARGETLDVSTGGFSSVLGRALQPGESVPFSITLATGLLQGKASVASIQQQGPAIRVSFRMEGLAPDEVDRMGTEVIDAALELLADLIEATP